jgi:hypothetical protein
VEDPEKGGVRKMHRQRLSETDGHAMFLKTYPLPPRAASLSEISVAPLPSVMFGKKRYDVEKLADEDGDGA